MRRSLLSATLLSILILRWTGVAMGQQPNDSREAATMAVELQSNGDWEGAYNLATQTLAACPDDDTGLSCRLRMLYTVGFIFEQSAYGERRQEFLEKAIDYYAAVLDKSPGHAATTRRLAGVYEQLGRLDQAEATIRSTEGGRDEREESRSGLQLGDLYVRRDAWDRALEQYRGALDSGQDSDFARQRMLFVYRNKPAASELLKLAREWEVEAPNSAADAYRLVIEQTYRDIDTRGLALEALESWILLVAELDDVEQAMQQLPKDWEGKEISDLLAYLRSPRRLPQDNWWLSSLKTRHALGKLALALGDDVKRTKGDPAWSLSCWGVGLEVSPETRAYTRDRDLRDKTPVRLELQTAIARVIGLRPDLDRGGRRLRSIEQEIFQGKGAAYTSGDLRAIQEHHTVLGLIYAGQRRWTSQRGDSGAANAIFQLEHALSTARERELSGDAPFAPFPTLRSHLATGYIETSQLADARRVLLEAAKDYLDAADSAAALRPAEAELRRFRELGGTVPRQQEADARYLAGWIRLRSRAGAQALVERVVARSDYDPIGDLANPTGGLIDDKFVARQTFKFQADLATALHQQKTEPAAQAAARVGSQAVHQAVKSGSLIGAGDLVRLRRAQSAMSPLLEKRSSGLKVTGTDPTAGAKSNSISLVREGGRRVWISIPQQTAVTAELAQQVGSRQLMESKVVVTAGPRNEVILQGTPEAVKRIQADTERVVPNRRVKSRSVERLKLPSK